MSEEVLNESKFNMWRCVVAFAHTDGNVDQSEIDHIMEYLRKVPFTKEQEATLLEDIKKPQDVAELFPLITEPVDRGQLIYYARLLFWSDGDFHQQEVAIIERLTEKVMNRLDLENIMHNADLAVEASQHEPSKGLRGLVERMLEKLS